MTKFPFFNFYFILVTQKVEKQKWRKEKKNNK